MSPQKSAEAIVVGGLADEGPNWFNRFSAEHSRSEAGAEMTAERPERRTKVGSGTAEGTSYVRQTLPACDESTEQFSP